MVKSGSDCRCLHSAEESLSSESCGHGMPNCNSGGRLAVNNVLSMLASDLVRLGVGVLFGARLRCCSQCIEAFTSRGEILRNEESISCAKKTHFAVSDLPTLSKS